MAFILVIGWQVAISLTPLDLKTLEPEEVSSLDLRDAQGILLRQEMSRAGHRGSWIKTDEISSYLIHATLASEDHDFYDHSGVDWWAMIRATTLNLKAGRLAFGGSTLTMQLARLIQKFPRTLLGKFKQMLLAGKLERHLNKSEVLEQYLNRVYYGNGCWGIERAAQVYFGKRAYDLSLGEATALAVIPRGPNYYDPFKHWDRMLTRRDQILKLMTLRGYISEEDETLTRRAKLRLHPSQQHFRAPHFVEYVKEQLPDEFKESAQVTTTLDWPLQERIEVAVSRHIDQLYWRNLTQAAVVVIRNRDGAVLAMVGSKDYADHKHHGAFNGVTAHLRPGSTLKPFVYGAAIELGDSPASIAFDVILPHEINKFYTKDVRSHGFARYREALAGSYNLSAVHTLQKVGIESLLHKLRTSGIWTLDKPDEAYDWGLAIGHARVRLLELTAAFSVFGRGGSAIKPRVIVEAERVDGSSFSDSIQEYPAVFSEEVSYLLFDILSDPDARRPMFGDSVPLHLPFKVALKTGTTKAFTDLWALGTTHEYTVGVWAGNFEGKPTARVKSVRGATPLLRAVYSAIVARFGNPTEPLRPTEIVNASICPVSGKLRGPHCPHEMKEVFIRDHEPKEVCDWHQKVCDQTTIVYPPELRAWSKAAHLSSQPSCKPQAELTRIRIVQPVAEARFVLEAHRPARNQRPPHRIIPTSANQQAVWTVNGIPFDEWIPRPGEHRVEVKVGSLSDSVNITYLE